MQTVKELYPDWEEGYGPSSYQPIIDAIGEVVVQVDDDDYQGDSRLLYRRGEEFGFLIFGWGSCSGCDALQAADTAQEVQALADGMEASVEWLSGYAMRDKLTTWEATQGQHWWRENEGKEFVRRCLEVLPASSEPTP